MKIYSATISAPVYLDTEHGEFRVWSDGSIDMWNYEVDNWAHFDELYFDDEIIAEIKSYAKHSINTKLTITEE